MYFKCIYCNKLFKCNSKECGISKEFTLKEDKDYLNCTCSKCNVIQGYANYHSWCLPIRRATLEEEIAIKL